MEDRWTVGYCLWNCFGGADAIVGGADAVFGKRLSVFISRKAFGLPLPPCYDMWLIVSELRYTAKVYFRSLFIL